MRVGGIVLCGGKSSRMGVPKATLPFGDEPMLLRVVRLLREVSAPAIHPIAVVAAADQALPTLPAVCRLVRDQRPERGPLEGLAAGIEALSADVDAVYATSCDVPLLVPEFVRTLLAKLGGHGSDDDFDAVVPIEGEFFHPLAAVYRVSVLDTVRALLAADRLRPAYIFDSVRTCRVDVSQLRAADPQLHTLMNLNRPEDYVAALRTAGLKPDEATIGALQLTQNQ